MKYIDYRELLGLGFDDAKKNDNVKKQDPNFI